MSSSGWRILADDLTGALDTAAAFCGQRDVPVFLRPVPIAATGAVDPVSPFNPFNSFNPFSPISPINAVQAVATGTRDVAAGVLHETLRACLPWLTAPGHLAFKKVDSLLRGNSLAEVAWLFRHGGFDGIVLAPAFPAQGRFTRHGLHWVGTPHGCGEPRDAIALREALAVLGVPVRVGVGAAVDAGGGVLLPDVACDADLADVAALVLPASQRWLWCGSAGLAWALARRAGLAPDASAGAIPGRTHLVTASRHPVLRAQLASLVPSPAALSDLASEDSLSPAQAQARLQQRCAQLVLIAPRPDNLVVVGGDTLLALCQAAGAQGLQASPSPRGGWGRARLQGGMWDGVVCYSRSGAFGAPDDLSDLLSSLTGVPGAAAPRVAGLISH